MDNHNLLIDRVKILMGGMSNRSFAKKCGISEGAVRNIMSGGETTTATLRKISEECGKPLWWFFSYEAYSKKSTPVLATDPINSFNEINENADCEIILSHKTSERPQRGKLSVDLSEKEYKIIAGLRKIGKEDYTDGCLEKIEAASKALSWE